MEKTINEYKQYNENPVSVWKERFTWKKNGKDPQYRISIPRYLKESSDFEGVIKSGVPTDSLKFFECVNKLADKYVTWAEGKEGEEKYTKADKEDMHRFFVGVMGEYFFYFLMTDVRCIQCCNENNEYNRYDFRYVYPFLNQTMALTSLVLYQVAKPTSHAPFR